MYELATEQVTTAPTSAARLGLGVRVQGLGLSVWVSDGAGNYGTDERCDVEPLQPIILTTWAFVTLTLTIR